MRVRAGAGLVVRQHPDLVVVSVNPRWSGWAGLVAAPTTGGSVADGTYGDITVSGSGATWTVDTFNGGTAFGDAAGKNTGTGPGDVAAGNHTHATYQLTSEKAAANGYPSLDASTRIPTAQLGTGTADITTFLRGDGSWQVPAGGSGLSFQLVHAAAFWRG